MTTPAMTRDDVGEFVDAARQLLGRVTELVEISRGLILNHVLYSGTRIIPAEGFVSIEFTVPMAAAAVRASSIASTLVLAAAPPQGTVPTNGNGVVTNIVPRELLVVPMTGTILTCYGSLNDVVFLGAWTRAQPTAGA